jgi:hypothetical protein
LAKQKFLFNQESWRHFDSLTPRPRDFFHTILVFMTHFDRDECILTKSIKIFKRSIIK